MMENKSQPIHPVGNLERTDHAYGYIIRGFKGLTKEEYATVHILAAMWANPNIYAANVSKEEMIFIAREQATKLFE